MTTLPRVNRILQAASLVGALDHAHAEDDDWNILTRTLLVEKLETDPDPDLLENTPKDRRQLILDDALKMRSAYQTLMTARDAGMDETITAILLDMSLCPIHLCDYAACFDDRVVECEPVRRIHPCHDT